MARKSKAEQPAAAPQPEGVTEAAEPAVWTRTISGTIGEVVSVYINGSERVYPRGVPLNLSEEEFTTLSQCGLL